jgi:hypothetical protein
MLMGQQHYLVPIRGKLIQQVVRKHFSAADVLAAAKTKDIVQCMMVNDDSQRLCKPNDLAEAGRIKRASCFSIC